MTVIHKTPKDWRISPNLTDYEQTRAAFRWSTAPNPCVGMGSGLCNIAYAAVDRHADGPMASRTALRRRQARPGQHRQQLDHRSGACDVSHDPRQALLKLPDNVTVMPAHGAGSSCGKNLSTELTFTIGEQRRTNPSVQPMSEDQFVNMITHGQPAAPAYFSVDAAMNKRVHPLLDQSRKIPTLSAAQVRQALKDGVRVVDARSVDDFAAGHLRGSVNVGFDGRFAETGGMVTDIGDKIALITYRGEEQDAALRLGRVGSDNAIGYLTVDHDGVFPTDLSDLVRIAPRITAAELDGLLAEDAVILIDIRNPGEVELGGIPGAVNIPLAQLRNRLDLIPTDKGIVVHCAGGWRSSVAASS